MIQNPSKYIVRVILCVMVFMTLQSCVSEAPLESGDHDDRAGIPFYIRINAVAAPSAVESRMSEEVKSLRVIVIDKTGILDINQKVTLDAASTPASAFEYGDTWRVTGGEKRIFLIANEESVKEVSITDMTGLPDDLPLDNFSDLLDYFRNKNSEAVGSALEKVLNRVYFENNYSDMTVGNTIYLPYTAYYEVTLDEYTLVEKTMHLVPVAAKFDFTFINYRREPVKVEEVIINSVNSHNFLNAQLASDEKYRPLNGETVWWIDWLKAVTDASQTNNTFNSFNRLWGWIKGYGLPVSNEPLKPLSCVPGEEPWIVSKLLDKDNPPKLNVGPFYAPESYKPLPGNIYDDYEKEGSASAADDDDGLYRNRDDQYYTLTFRLHDTSTDEVTTLSGYEIETLKALFRGTHIVVTVELYESQVAIYAEIAPWEQSRFIGYVQEDDD